MPIPTGGGLPIKDTSGVTPPRPARAEGVPEHQINTTESLESGQASGHVGYSRSFVASTGETGTINDRELAQLGLQQMELAGPHAHEVARMYLSAIADPMPATLPFGTSGHVKVGDYDKV